MKDERELQVAFEEVLSQLKDISHTLDCLRRRAHEVLEPDENRAYQTLMALVEDATDEACFVQGYLDEYLDDY